MAATVIVPQTSSTASATRNEKKSFAQILSGKLVEGDVSIRKPITFCNKPAIEFTVDEERVLSENYKFALVEKFSRGLPIFRDIHPVLVKLGLRGSFTVGALKPGYVLINPSLEEDFARLWVRQEWFIAGRTMRLFKWTPSFTYTKESAIAPVWISLPDLPMHLFAKGALYSIASLIGNPIKVDESTANRSRPSIARVCVEIDLLQPTASQVIIKNGNNIFEQKVFVEDKPSFCNLCFHREHLPTACFSNGQTQPPARTKKITQIENPNKETNQPPLRNRNLAQPENTLNHPLKDTSNTLKRTNNLTSTQTNHYTNTQHNNPNTGTQTTENVKQPKQQTHRVHNQFQPKQKIKKKRVSFHLRPIIRNKKTKNPSHILSPPHRDPEAKNQTNNTNQKQTLTETSQQITTSHLQKIQPPPVFNSAMCETGECSKNSRSKFGKVKVRSKWKVTDREKEAPSGKSLVSKSQSTNLISTNPLLALALLDGASTDLVQFSAPQPDHREVLQNTNKKDGNLQSDSCISPLSILKGEMIGKNVMAEEEIESLQLSGLLSCKETLFGPIFSGPTSVNKNEIDLTHKCDLPQVILKSSDTSIVNLNNFFLPSPKQALVSKSNEPIPSSNPIEPIPLQTILPSASTSRAFFSAKMLVPINLKMSKLNVS